MKNYEEFHKQLMKHLEFIIKLESDVKASFATEGNEEMRKHASISRTTMINIYDYCKELEKKVDKQ